MASRAASKPARSVGKTTAKPPGKDQTKGDKQPASVLEIVPGKFNETDWLSLLENDDTEDFIADIFESIWTDTSKQIEQIYIRRQLLPFTVMMTENALSNVIQVTRPAQTIDRHFSLISSGHSWNETSRNQRMATFGTKIPVSERRKDFWLCSFDRHASRTDTVYDG